MFPAQPESDTPPSDQLLLLAVRAGDTTAYAQLWARHADAIRFAARRFTSFDADDITAETFARILRTIERGHGPRDTFRAYAVVTARNIAAEWARSPQPVALDDLDDRADPTLAEFFSEFADDRSLAAGAFRALPDRWQQAIWYSEVQGMKPAEIAPILGMKPNAVAALTVRAREGLRQNWIQAHLNDDTVSDDHKWVIQRAGQYARNKLAAQTRLRIDAHLTGCDLCRNAYLETETANSRIALLLFFPIAGGSAAAGTYTAWTATTGPGASAASASTAKRTLRRARITIAAVTFAAASLTVAGVALPASLSAPAPQQISTGRTPPDDVFTSGASVPDASPHPSADAPPDSFDNAVALPNNEPQEPAPRTSTPSGPGREETRQAEPPPPPVNDQTDSPHNTSPAAAVPTPAPRTPPPTVTLVQATSAIAPTLRGAASPHATITTTWSPTSASPVTTLTRAATDGTWEQGPPSSLPPGTYRITITQTRPDTSTSSSPVVTTATIAPPAATSSDSNDM